MKKIFVFIILLFLSFSCKKQTITENLNDLTFKEITQSAKGSSVNFYMWGGSAPVNQWIDQFVTSQLAKKYDIKLNRIPADASVFINKLLGEKQAKKEKGSIDLIWINGENFKNAKENDLLYGPFLEQLPNFQKYVNQNYALTDFGYPIEGYEAPYGKAQFVFEYDFAKISAPPTNIQLLKEWIINHPGQFTYPAPPDFTGSAFIRTLFYSLSENYQVYFSKQQDEQFLKESKKLYAFLNEIKPYLWEKGKSYPQSSNAHELLFEKGEVAFFMNYNQSHAQYKIAEGTYPDTVRTYVMTGASLFNTHYTAIPFNSQNKAGAMVVANYLMSPEVQLSKNDPANWGDFTILDLDKLSQEMKNQFEQLDLGDAVLPLDVLDKNGVPEIPAYYVEKLEQGWLDNVYHK
ncbi:MAG: ABC transporter substrate-binding protein [Spirochaetes bacterium]|nr:ABC transporter substrate-binding protein [Spirochaetota bacterium]